MTNTNENIDKIAQLPCWSSGPAIEPLTGGITNQNFVVNDGSDKYVVRLGNDIFEHLVLRANELCSAQAAFEIGVTPEITYHEDGVLVMHFVEGKVFTDQDIIQDENLQRIITLLKRFHREMPKQLVGYPIMFWVFQVIRHYEHVLRVGRSEHFHKLPDFIDIAHQLEIDVGPVEIVFAHNDLLAANLIDDGRKLWLIDFDYAGFNSPLFDLANLASNNGLSVEQEHTILADYFEYEISAQTWKSYNAMKCASLLRETMWSMVSEIHSEIDFDYSVYTEENLSRFEQAYADYQSQFPSL